MKHQLQTIREFIESAHEGEWASYVDRDAALTALSELERMAGEQKPILIVQHGEICYKSQDDDQTYGMWCPVTPDTEHGLRNGTQLYAAPPAQQPQEEHLTITWDEQQTRILAVSMQDEEGRILKVLAEAPARQPHERHLLNLLARIHGDGGHYTAEHGLEKSVSDADQKVADLHLKAWEAQQPQRITPAELAKRIERGEKWQLDEQPVGRVDGDGHVTWFAPIPEGGANLYAAQQPQAEAVTEDTSDGYHTFKELYAFRKAYNAALFNEWGQTGKCQVHKSWRHHDGELCFGGGWFIVVALLPDGQISNHYEAKDWDLFNVPETDKALYEFDGHTGADVVARLEAYKGGDPAAPQQAEAVPHDMGAMELAESVGLIGPASRTDDFHAAIQRFHDLISMNVSIKAAVHFAQGLPKKGGAA